MASAQPRVLILTHLYPGHVWPTNGIFIHQHIEALVRGGVDLRVIVPVPWTPWPLPVLKPGWDRYRRLLTEGRFGSVTVQRAAVPIPPGKLQWLGGPSMALRLTPVLLRLRRSFRFNLIHAHTATPDGWAAWWISRLLKVPFLCSVRGSDINEYPFESLVRRWATRRALRAARQIIAVSQALAEATENLTGRLPVVVYNGVDSSFCPPTTEEREAARRDLGVPPRATNVAFVGRCEIDKGVIELVSSFAVLYRRHPELHLTLVGSGQAWDQVRSMARGAGCTDRLHQVPSVDHGRIRHLLYGADVFALPSYGEGMPNALIEAMACGLPCVATDVGGIPEIVIPGTTGTLVSPRSTSELTNALDRMIGNRDAARAMGKAAARRIRELCSWDANATRHAEIYREVLAP